MLYLLLMNVIDIRKQTTLTIIPTSSTFTKTGTNYYQ